MFLAFGVVILGFIAAIAAAFAAPLAVVVGGITRLRGMRRGGFAAGFFAWVVLTAAAIVALMLGMSGNAGSGVKCFGLDLEELLALAPWALLLAALASLGFSVAARRHAKPRAP